MPYPTRSRNMFASSNCSQSTIGTRSGALDLMPTPALQVQVLPRHEQELAASTISCVPTSSPTSTWSTSLNPSTPTYASRFVTTGVSTADGVSPAVVSSMAPWIPKVAPRCAGNKTPPQGGISPVLASRVVHSAVSPAPVFRKNDTLHTGGTSVSCAVSNAIPCAFGGANVSPLTISAAVSSEFTFRQSSAPAQGRQGVPRRQTSAHSKLINNIASLPIDASTVPAPTRQSTLSPWRRPAVSPGPAYRDQLPASSASPGPAYRGYASPPRQTPFGHSLKEARVVAPQQASSLPDLASPRLMIPEGWHDVVAELRSDQSHDDQSHDDQPIMAATPPIPRLALLGLPHGNTLPTEERLAELRADVESKAARQVGLAESVLLGDVSHECESVLQDASKVKELIGLLEHELVLRRQALAFWKARLTQLECREQMDAICERWNLSSDGTKVASSDTTVACDAIVEHEVVNTTSDSRLLAQGSLTIAEQTAATNASKGQHCVDSSEDEN